MTLLPTLSTLGYRQAVWTLLSVVEDHHYKITAHRPLDEMGLNIYADGLLNAITHPLRICAGDSFPFFDEKINRDYVSEDYGAASDWLEKSEDYNHFCALFPLFRNGDIELTLSEKTIVPTDWAKLDLSSEAYDRFIPSYSEKTKPVIGKPPTTNVFEQLQRQTKIKGNRFHLKLNRRLVKKLKAHLHESFVHRFSLPDDWVFNHFSLREFKEIFGTIHAMAVGWSLARRYAAEKGILGVGYRNSLWTPNKKGLACDLCCYTGISQTTIDKVLEYLTFGKVVTQYPDIAIQPFIDLKNGELAISPFVLQSVNCERNLCVLLNQIEEERDLYSRLVDGKEKN